MSVLGVLVRGGRERGDIWGGDGRRTDYGLGVVGAGGAEAEFAEVVFAFLGEGVESGFGGLGVLASLRKSRDGEWVYHGCGVVHSLSCGV
jgi:hypothetical protein